MNIAPESIEKKITKKTKALVPVHLFGRCADMTRIMKIAKDHNLKVVEDMAQGIGATWSGQSAGSFGDAACLSFFPTKNLGGFGDGGMIVTQNAEIAGEVKVLRGHGSRKTYYYDEIGTNSRLDEIQAAVLRVKLRHLNAMTEKRRTHAALYNKELAVFDATLPADPEGGRHAYHQYTLRHPRRDKIREALLQNGIGSMIYYPLSLHLQKAYAHLGCHPGDLPESEKAPNEVLSLPIFPELTPNEQKSVIESLTSILAASACQPVASERA